MQVVAVELMAKLRDVIEAIEGHLSALDMLNLQRLEGRLPKNARAASPEMVMLALVYREIDQRNGRA